MAGEHRDTQAQYWYTNKYINPTPSRRTLHSVKTFSDLNALNNQKKTLFIRHGIPSEYTHCCYCYLKKYILDILSGAIHIGIDFTIMFFLNFFKSLSFFFKKVSNTF